MRKFALFASKGFTTPFSLKDLTKGRMDLVARCISSAFFVSYKLRKDTTFYLFLYGPPDPPRQITFYGEELKGITPDEKSIGRKLNEILRKGKNLKLNEGRKVESGIYVAKKSFEKFLKKRNEKIIYLHPRGMDIREYKFPKNFLFVLGDHKGLPSHAERLLKRLDADKLSLGKVEYLASHCIVIIHNELDRRGI